MLKAVLDSLEGLGEGVDALYTQGDDGRYYLELDGVDDHPTVRGLKSALERTKKERGTAKDRLAELEAQFGDVDLERYQELLAKVEADGGGGGDADAKVQRAIQAAEKKWGQKVKELEDELAVRDSAIHFLTVETELTAAVDSLGIPSEYKAGAKALLEKGKPKVIRDPDHPVGFRGVFQTDLGDVDIAAHVKNDWAKSDVAQAYLPPDKRTGSGTPPGETGGQKHMRPGTFDRSDPMAWGKNADAILKGEVTPG